MKNLKTLSIFIIAICFTMSNAIANVIEKWQETTGTFEIKHTSKQNATTPNTVVAKLIQVGGHTIDDAIAEDGKTVHYFAVSYNIPVVLDGGKKSTKVKRVTQYGLYRTLDTDLREALNRHHSPLPITIRYDEDNPISFKFVIDNTVYTTPLLVRD